MIPESTLQLVRSTKNIAIAIADETTGDQIGASLGLLNFLISQNKKVDFLFTEKLPSQFSFLASYFPEKEPTATKADSLRPALSEERAELRDFIISLDAKKLGVEEIRYEKNGDALSVILGAKQNISSKDIAIKSADDYDLVISFGMPKREAIAAKAGTNALRMMHTPILLLSRNAIKETDADATLADTEAASWCELAWGIITATQNEQKITETVATPLLAGLFTATKNLQSPETTVASAKLASLLVKYGAKQELIREHLENKKEAPLNLMQLWARTLSRSRLDDTTGILWSFIPAEDFLKTGSTSQNFSFVFPRMEQAVSPKTGFLYVFENPHKNHIRAILKSKDDSLLDRAAALEAGDRSQKTLIFHKSFTNFAEAEEELRGLLAKVIQ